MRATNNTQIRAIQFVQPEKGDFRLIAISSIIDFGSEQIEQAKPSNLAIANDTIVYLDVTFACLILFRGLAAILNILKN